MYEVIKKVGNKYVLYPKKGGKRLGTHDTKKAARNQEKAVKASKYEHIVVEKTGCDCMYVSVYERVDDKKNIINSINFCFKEDDNALIEEEISGREISVGVIKYKNEIISQSAMRREERRPAPPFAPRTLPHSASIEKYQKSACMESMAIFRLFSFIARF